MKNPVKSRCLATTTDGTALAWRAAEMGIMGDKRGTSSHSRGLSSFVVVLPLAAILLACGATAGQVAEEKASNASDAGPPPSNGNGSFGDQSTDGDGGADDSAECGKMDIVFVVDNSGSMGQEQENLAANFPKFAGIIDAYKTKSGKLLDYRLAVTTSDANGGKGGAFVKESGSNTGLPFPIPGQPPPCDAGPARPWLERTDAKVVDSFACRARVGTGGSGIEQPLASLLLGLTDRIADGTNAAGSAGFLRDDALLAFVVLTDEDEALRGFGGTGMATIAEFPPAFDKLKGDERGRWAAAVIAGEQSCNSAGFGSAKEAKELKKFIADVGKNGVFSSICAGDLTEGLTKALATFDLACKTFPSGPK